MTNIINSILKKDPDNPLYCYTNRCLIQEPCNDDRTYGWHQEIFYTIPKSSFIQTWAPLVRDTTKENGTIWIAEKSIKEDIALQTWNDVPNRVTQILVNDDIVNKYNQKQIEMKLGSLLIFSGKTIHKSGYNLSNNVRYSLVGMYHDISYPTFETPITKYNYRGLTPKEYFSNFFKNI